MVFACTETTRAVGLNAENGQPLAYQRGYAATRAVWECIATACARGLPLHKRITSLPTVLESADYRENQSSSVLSTLEFFTTRVTGASVSSRQRGCRGRWLRRQPGAHSRLPPHTPGCAHAPRPSSAQLQQAHTAQTAPHCHSLFLLRLFPLS
eukprot:scaffold94247_cov61-Phaeocystis_antarctica.AAC.3